MATTLTCLDCGESVRAADRFCSRCGTELTASSLPDPSADPHPHPDDDPESPWTEVVQRLRRATRGEFDVGRELGRGGMAAVFLAHDIALDRKVAIKVMSPGLLMGEGMIERFKREAITIAHLNHPNIVSCFSVRQAEGLHFFVMRYIQGRSLDQVIRDAGRLPIPIVRSILGQVSSALTYAHRSRVVHRDIKPANILIDVDGNAVVTDFGIAKVARLPGHTHTGALVGTPAYMSPEQCAGTEVTGAHRPVFAGRGGLRDDHRPGPVHRLGPHRDAVPGRRAASADPRAMSPTAPPTSRPRSSACSRRARPIVSPTWPRPRPRSARRRWPRAIPCWRSSAVSPPRRPTQT